jgi:hypothetical protein
LLEVLRDTLILETVAHFVGQETRNLNIAFVCNDFLLRTTAGNRLSSDSRFGVYESLSEFSSYIKLTRERLTNEFIRAIMKRARDKFFKKGDPLCLWERENIHQKIVENFGTKFNPNSDLGVDISLTTWKPTGRFRIILESTKFQNISGERTYHWIRPIRIVRLFHPETTSPFVAAAAVLGGSPTPTEDHILVVTKARPNGVSSGNVVWHIVQDKPVRLEKLAVAWAFGIANNKTRPSPQGLEKTSERHS